MCVLLEHFIKFLVDPYYEPLSWFMIYASQYTQDLKMHHKNTVHVYACMTIKFMIQEGHFVFT